MSSEARSEIIRGTLDLMVLKTLATMGPLHGYGIARRIEQISEDALQINQGTIYASLVRLMQKRWISGAGARPTTTGGRSSIRSPKRDGSSSRPRPELERVSTVIGRVLAYRGAGMTMFMC